MRLKSASGEILLSTWGDTLVDSGASDPDPEETPVAAFSSSRHGCSFASKVRRAKFTASVPEVIFTGE